MYFFFKFVITLQLVKTGSSSNQSPSSTIQQHYSQWNINQNGDSRRFHLLRPSRAVITQIGVFVMYSILTVNKSSIVVTERISLHLFDKIINSKYFLFIDAGITLAVPCLLLGMFFRRNLTGKNKHRCCLLASQCQHQWCHGYQLWQTKPKNNDMGLAACRSGTAEG